jgi:hypothetical protein
MRTLAPLYYILISRPRLFRAVFSPISINFAFIFTFYYLLAPYLWVSLGSRAYFSCSWKWLPSCASPPLPSRSPQNKGKPSGESLNSGPLQQPPKYACQVRQTLKKNATPNKSPNVTPSTALRPFISPCFVLSPRRQTSTIPPRVAAPRANHR